MKFTTLAEDQLPHLVKLWNKELGESFPMREELFRQNSLHDINVYIPASIVAYDGTKVIGFIISKVWQETLEEVSFSKETAWIQVILVDQEYREKGIGTNLLQMAEEVLKKAGIKKVLIGRDPWHYFPGVPAEYQNVRLWFEKKGYNSLPFEYDLRSTDMTFNDVNPNSMPDVQFSLLTLEKKDLFLAFLDRCFPGRWEYEAIKYFQKGGTGREFVIVEKENRMIGFCRINDSLSPFIAQNVYWAPLLKDELGGIGPLGIDPLERGYGYGLAVVWSGVYFLNQRGIQNIVIDWTALVSFYQKLGFEVWKSYKKYEKEL